MKLLDLVIKLLNFKPENFKFNFNSGNQRNIDLTKVYWRIFELKIFRTEFKTNL